MSRRKGRVNRRSRNHNLIRSGEDVNPMSYISNLSDAMLVLAVGIMVALVLHWNVDLESKQEEAREQEEQQVVSFQDDELENQDKVPDNAQQAGQVYYDAESDTYYIVGSDGQTTQMEDAGQ